MKHLNESDFRSRFTMRDYLGACRRAFELYGRGEIVNPQRLEEAGDGFFRLEMKAEWKGCCRIRKTIEERSDVGTGRLGTAATRPAAPTAPAEPQPAAAGSEAAAA